MLATDDGIQSSVPEAMKTHPTATNRSRIAQSKL